MYNFTLQIPTRIHFGKDTISYLSELKEYGDKVLLVYGGGSIKKNGIEISYIQRDLITVIFYYQISLKPLKTLSLSQVSFPLLFPLYYIVP